MTSFVIKEGKKVVKYECPVCGQIEGYFAGEVPEEVCCHNCSCLMIPMEERKLEPIPEPEPEVKPDPHPEVMELGTENASVEEPARRRGRPPKIKSNGKGSCDTCSKALTAIHGYTCEEDWKTHRGDDNCDKYKKGKPVD